MQAIENEKVLQRFLSPDGQLRQIPVKPAKLRVVLAHLADSFVPGERYPEKAVNEILLRFHPDFCTLRRHLVDAGFMARRDGVYWRV